MIILSMFFQTCVTLLDALICHVRRFCAWKAGNCRKIKINALNPEFPKEDAKASCPRKTPIFVNLLLFCDCISWRLVGCWGGSVIVDYYLFAPWNLPKTN